MLEFMLLNGTTVVYDRDDCERTPDLLEGARVHLGCLGVVTRLRLDVVPYFEVAAYRYDDVPLETAIESLPDIFKKCDSLSIWTSGFGTGPGAGLAWMAYRHFHPHWDASRAVPQHESPAFGRPLVARMQRYLTDPDDPQYYSPTTRGPWSTTLALTIDDDLLETSMAQRDLQSEFFVPLEHAQEAVRVVSEVASSWSFSSPHSSVGTPVRGLVDAFEFRCVPRTVNGTGHTGPSRFCATTLCSTSPLLRDGGLFNQIFRHIKHNFRNRTCILDFVLPLQLYSDTCCFFIYVTAQKV